MHLERFMGIPDRDRGQEHAPECDPHSNCQGIKAEKNFPKIPDDGYHIFTITQVKSRWTRESGIMIFQERLRRP
jgi:hypothetical protein